MLKGIPPILSPDLLKVLAEMGHGDDLVIGDCNYPATSTGKRCVRQDGHGNLDLLDAILQLLPLDTFVAAPVALMQVVPGSLPGEPPIWQDYRRLVHKHQQDVEFEEIERFAFYERARAAFATVATGERSLYACIILKKGVL
jgi:L-fucose mutarotase